MGAIGQILDASVVWEERVRVPGSPERERFVLAHAALVRRIAQRMLARLPSHVELADLVNDGIVGLIEAIDRYDPARGVRFASFAESRVRGAILDALRARDTASRTLRRKLRALDNAAMRVEHRLGRSPSVEEIALELGVSEAQVAELVREREAARPAAGESAFDGSEVEAALYSRAPDPFEQVSRAEIQERLVGLIAALPHRERLVLGLYYEKGLTMREVGEVLSVTESRVCQIHSRCVRELKRRLDRLTEPAPGVRNRSRAWERS